MPGGTFNGVQNKVVPGVYVDARGQFIPANTNNRGITYFKYNMSWFSEAEEDNLAYVNMTRDEYFSSLSYSRLGISFDDNSEFAQLCEVVFRNSYRIVVEPFDGTGYAKAAGSVDDIVVTAKKNGTFGNTLSVSSIQDTVINTLYNIRVYSNGRLIESYNGISTKEQFNELSDFIEITGGDLRAFSAISLEGGANVTDVEDDPSVIVEQVIAVLEDYPVINSVFIGDLSLSNACAEMLQQRIENILNNEGIRAIHNYVGSYSANSRYAFRIANDGWIDDNGVVFDTVDFMGFVAGANAGLGPNESLTYMRVGGVKRTIRSSTEETASSIRQGIVSLLQLYERPGNPYVVIAKDVNTLTTFTTDQPEFMSDGNVTRIENDIVQNVKEIGERIIIGKTRNTDVGRAILHSQISNYLSTLVQLQVLAEFNPERDLQVIKGSQPNGVLVKYNLRLASVIEYIYNEVNIIVEEAA